MHASVIYVRIVVIGFKMYWSIFRGTGHFLEVLVALNHCRPVWAGP